MALSACKKDPCKDVNCVNGDCVDGTCVCAAGYEGADCSTAENDKFLGTWDMPCDGHFAIPLAGIDQNMPIPNQELVLDGDGNPSSVVVDFTIPLVNQQITMTGQAQGDSIIFTPNSFDVPQEITDSLIAMLGQQIPISITLSVDITGFGYLQDENTLIVDINIDLVASPILGSIGGGTIHCIGTRVQ